MTTDIVPHGRIVIAGGSGFLGVNLARYLENFDCEVIILSRNRPAETGNWEHATWDARTLGDWAAKNRWSCCPRKLGWPDSRLREVTGSL